MKENNYITITQLSRYLKYKFDNDVHLNTVYLKGEISNFKAHTRGHYYFTLKDEGSRINAVMFASSVKGCKFVPIDGMKVMVTGKVTVYEATGGYQIYVTDMLEDGVGNLYVAYEQLKKKLEEEGFLNIDYPITPIDADVVIIDEMSMVDMFLMNHILKAIYLGTKLVLVGDINQLPSVGPRNSSSRHNRV